MAALPRVVANPMQGAAAAGLLSQLAALVTFVTPLMWQPILQSRRGRASSWWWEWPRPSALLLFRAARAAVEYHARANRGCIMGFIANLVPREGKFFEYFNAHASRAAEASNELTLLLSEYTDVGARAARIERINTLEHEADRITHDTAALLHTIFVTPLDRDDIHRLISRMDDVLDLIQDAAESLHLYDVQSVTSHAVELAQLLREGCERPASPPCGC